MVGRKLVVVPACTNLEALTRHGFRRTVASKEFPHECNYPKETPATVTNETEDLESQIRQRAHELDETRGREDGHELEDWLRAEEELTAKAEE